MAEVKKEASNKAVKPATSKPTTAPKATAKVESQVATPKAATKPAKKAEKQIKVTLVKSTNKCVSSIKKTVQALGLHRIGETKIHNDNPAIRGAIFKVKHMVVVEEVNGKEAK